MKALILALALLTATSSFAREGHEGPEAAPKSPAAVIAKVVTSAFFVAPTAPQSTIVEIRADGSIDQILDYRDGRTEIKAVATLAAEVLKQLATMVSEVKETLVRDPNPASPGCMDAPSTTFYAVQGGHEIVIAARENCKDLEKVDESDADRSLKRALNGAVALASVIR